MKGAERRITVKTGNWCRVWRGSPAKFELHWLVTWGGVSVTEYIGILRLRCAPLRMTLKSKGKDKSNSNRSAQVESPASHVWPTSGQTWGTNDFYLFDI